LGLGEAGSVIAADLVTAGCSVAAWDPHPKHVPSGVNLAANAQEAVLNADLVLSVNLASVAAAVARSVMAGLNAQQVYADLNTASPALKREIAEILHPSGVLFVDVALLAAVAGRGIRTPALLAGPGATQFHDWLAPLGMPLTILEGPVGGAAARKLIRSIFMKGAAAVVSECLAAAHELECEIWAREQLLTALPDEKMIDRFVEGSRTHAARRADEMRAAAALLAELEVGSDMTDATLRWLEKLAAGQAEAKKEKSV
jgi:3-hydroxyisobutyrate dehydrogenase-like beta-hydroxyacid dehydrogenase